jgi:hypothetical protein
MTTSLVIVFGLTSIIFLSMLLLGAALFMRKQWDELANSARSTPHEPTRGDSASH